MYVIDYATLIQLLWRATLVLGLRSGAGVDTADAVEHPFT